jgi:hypothetical protein
LTDILVAASQLTKAIVAACGDKRSGVGDSEKHDCARTLLGCLVMAEDRQAYNVMMLQGINGSTEFGTLLG